MDIQNLFKFLNELHHDQEKINQESKKIRDIYWNEKKYLSLEEAYSNMAEQFINLYSCYSINFESFSNLIKELKNLEDLIIKIQNETKPLQENYLTYDNMVKKNNDHNEEYKEIINKYELDEDTINKYKEMLEYHNKMINYHKEMLSTYDEIYEENKEKIKNYKNLIVEKREYIMKFKDNFTEVLNDLIKKYEVAKHEYLDKEYKEINFNNDENFKDMYNRFSNLKTEDLVNIYASKLNQEKLVKDVIVNCKITTIKSDYYQIERNDYNTRLMEYNKLKKLNRYMSNLISELNFDPEDYDLNLNISDRYSYNEQIYTYNLTKYLDTLQPWPDSFDDSRWTMDKYEFEYCMNILIVNLLNVMNGCNEKTKIDKSNLSNENLNRKYKNITIENISKVLINRLKLDVHNEPVSTRAKNIYSMNRNFEKYKKMVNVVYSLYRAFNHLNFDVEKYSFDWVNSGNTLVYFYYCYIEAHIAFLECYKKNLEFKDFEFAVTILISRILKLIFKYMKD